MFASDGPMCKTIPECILCIKLSFTDSGYTQLFEHLDVVATLDLLKQAVFELTAHLGLGLETAQFGVLQEFDTLFHA